MSLLLKALQNAAKNREAGAEGDASEPIAAAPESRTATPGSAAPSELTLEPLDSAASAEPTGRFEPGSKSKPASDPAPRGTEKQTMANRTQAQNVFLAGARSTPIAESASPGIIDWLTRRPLIAFSTAAGLFAIGYGVYLYLQLTNPGIFVSRSGPVAPPPVAPAPSPAAQTPAPPPVAAAPSILPPAAPPTPPAPESQLAPPPAVPSPATDARSSTAPLAAAPSPAPAAATSPQPVAAPPSRPAPVAGPSQQAPATQASGTPAKPATSIVAAAPSEPRVAARPAPPPRPASVAARARSAPAPAKAAVVPSVGPDLAGAYQALERGQLNDAERLYRQVLASDPRNVDAMIGLGAALGQQNRADAATQMYMRALEIDPQNSYAQAGLLSIGGRADPQAAEIRLKQLIAREPSAFLYFTLGNLYADQNQWAAAQGAYFQAFNMSPDNPDYAFNLAVGLEHLSQPKLALDYYRRAVSMAQARGNAQFAVAQVQSRIRSLEAALAEQP